MCEGCWNCGIEWAEGDVEGSEELRKANKMFTHQLAGFLTLNQMSLLLSSAQLET